MDVVAGDGTKVKAAASMAAGATAEQLEIEIGELEALLAAEVEAWFAQARAADAAEDALFGEGGEDGGGAGAGGTMTLARLTGKIVRRQKAKARLDAEAAERHVQATAAHRDKIARLERRAARHQAQAARLEAEAAAKVAGYQRRAAAKAAAGSRKRPDGRAPAAPGDHCHVRRARQALAAAERALATAKAAPPDPGTAGQDPPKANTTDPASRVMPLKKGGFDQLHNMQALAGKHQVIYAIGTHDNPTAPAPCTHCLAKPGPTWTRPASARRSARRCLTPAYASDTNFTTPCEPQLYVAITKEARQTGRLRDGQKPATMKESWQQMAARLDTPEGKALYRRRAGIIEPVFAQLFARLGRHLNYRDTKVDLELHLWAASHNFLKAIRAGQPRGTATPGPAPAC